LASAGTDGSDFIPEAAGAIVDNKTLETLTRKAANFRSRIEYYDSYNILNITGNSLIITGDTHTNVGDIILYLFPAGDRPV
jgi:hydroxypyruvate reductase/glycerate 2-kinase